MFISLESEPVDVGSIIPRAPVSGPAPIQVAVTAVPAPEHPHSPSCPCSSAELASTAALPCPPSNPH